MTDHVSSNTVNEKANVSLYQAVLSILIPFLFLRKGGGVEVEYTETLAFQGVRLLYKERSSGVR